MKPTDKQVKELWEWCGFTGTTKEKYVNWFQTVTLDVWELGDYSKTYLPPIDLNNLFKYAVPITLTVLKDKWFKDKGNYLTDAGAYQELFNLWSQRIYAGMNDVDALFWALDKVRCK